MTWRFKVGEVALVAGDAKIRAETALMPGDEVTVVALIDRMEKRTSAARRTRRTPTRCRKSLA